MSMSHRPVSSSSSEEQQLSSFIAKFEPDNQKLIRSVRKALRKRFPTANELVYDYRNNFVIGYSPLERGSDAIVALTADVDGVYLYFGNGASLPDPHKILLGDGRQTRFIRLESAGVLLQPEIEALMTAAVRKARIPLPESGRGAVIIKPMSWKQRPQRRPVKH